MTSCRTTFRTDASCSPRHASGRRERFCSMKTSRSTRRRTKTATKTAFVLHVMDEDGTNIHQISFNQSHDLDPAVLADGRIVFTRWEHHIDNNQMDLYSINPDGTELQLLYGAHSHNTGTTDPTTGQPTDIQFLNPRPMQDGRTLALVRPFQGTNEGGDLILIDTANLRRQHAADRPPMPA